MSRNPLFNMILDDSNDDQMEIISILAAMEEERVQKQRSSSSRRGSVVGRTLVNRDYIQGHERLFQDYFAHSPVYNAKLFRRRFRMNCSLFLRIQSEVEAHDPYFVQRRNCAGVLGLSSLQKITVALRMLAYGHLTLQVANYFDVNQKPRRNRPNEISYLKLTATDLRLGLPGSQSLERDPEHCLLSLG